MRMAQLSQNRFVHVRAFWDPLVDPLLTRLLALADNSVADSHRHLRAARLGLIHSRESATRTARGSSGDPGAAVPVTLDSAGEARRIDVQLLRESG